MKGDGFGADKKARLAAQRRQEAELAAKEAASVRLNPPWPWPVDAFDPVRAGLTKLVPSNGSQVLE